MSIITKNIKHIRRAKISAWRKISLGTWRITGDSSVYGMLEMNVEPALDYLKNIESKYGKKLTLTHLVARAMAQTFREHPQINSIIRWGKLYNRKDVDIFIHVALDEAGEDLSGIVIRNLDKKNLLEVADEIRSRVHELKTQGDPSFKKIKNSIHFVPSWILKHVLDFVGFILYTLNLWSPLLNVARDPFGSAMVTNIGPLGAEFAFTPIPYYSRIPFILSIGEVKDGIHIDPETKEIQVKKKVKFGVTFDHRIIDGVHAAKLSRTFRNYIENPALLER